MKVADNTDLTQGITKVNIDAIGALIALTGIIIRGIM